MADLENYVFDWLSYYGDLSSRSASRWRVISREVERREYTSGKLVSDVLDFWMTATEGWYSTLLGCARGVPTLVFHLSPHTESASQSISVRASRRGRRLPHFDFLPLAQPACSDKAKLILKENFKAELSDPGDELFVELIDLCDPNKKESLIKTSYHVLVHMDDLPLALVYVCVQ